MKNRLLFGYANYRQYMEDVTIAKSWVYNRRNDSFLYIKEDYLVGYGAQHAHSDDCINQ